MEPQKQSVWNKMPIAVKVLLGLVGGVLFVAMLLLQAGNGGLGFSCH